MCHPISSPELRSRLAKNGKDAEMEQTNKQAGWRTWVVDYPIEPDAMGPFDGDDLRIKHNKIHDSRFKG